MDDVERVPPSLRLELHKPSVHGMAYRHTVPVASLTAPADVDLSLEASDPLQVTENVFVS